MKPGKNSLVACKRREFRQRIMTAELGPAWEKNLDARRRTLVRNIVRQAKLSTLLGGRVTLLPRRARRPIGQVHPGLVNKPGMKL